LWGILGTVDFVDMQSKLGKAGVLGVMVGVAGLLIFCGAMGKSAQFPLHVWLPDAMEGPTPVSALIHAATMVAAGGYMLCRLFFLYKLPVLWPESLAFLGKITPLDIIAWIGGITALLAALIAVQQNDIKRILAYSTLSQLGYMVMAVGLIKPGLAMFHLTTHAFFKALLFLGAGSVICALHHEQDIWKMGGLRKHLPITWITFLIATLAICGVPPFSGFYSKDAILAAALDPKTGKLALFILAMAVAGLTSFYMFRLFFVAFHGPVKQANATHAHESPPVMTGPLVILAVLSVIGGLIGIPAFLGNMPLLPAEGHPASIGAAILEPFNHSPLAAFLGLFVTLLGFSFACALYAKATRDPLPEKLGLLAMVLRQKFYFDELYLGIIELTHEALAKVADWIDTWIISGVGVRGTHGATELAGRALRLVQTGSVQTYAFFFTAGVVILLWRMLR
jgi:NADH-quinone oxidoreductase subunit L